MERGLPIRSSIVLFFNLIFITSLSATKQILTTDNEVKWVLSPNFPLPYGPQSKVFLHFLQASDSHWHPKRYLRITTEDFLLSSQSTLKIYDGHDNSAPSVVWRRGGWPVYQSSGSSLLVVFKPGKDMTKAEMNSSIGFSIQVKLVSESRELWAESSLPNTGFCGSIELNSSSSGSMVTVGRQPGGRVFTYDCTWVINVTEAVYVAILLPSLGWTEDGTVAVREGLTSRGLVAPPTLGVTTSARHKSPVALYRDAQLHIRLHRQLFRDTTVALTFHQDRDRALAMMESLSPLPGDDADRCPFKRCPQGACVLYWEACRDTHANADSSCDDTALGTSVCSPGGSATQCYNAKFDVFDGFSDCSNAADEKITAKPTKRPSYRSPKTTYGPPAKPDANQAWAIIGGMALATTVIVVCIVCCVSGPLGKCCCACLECRLCDELYGCCRLCFSECVAPCRRRNTQHGLDVGLDLDRPCCRRWRTCCGECRQDCRQCCQEQCQEGCQQCCQEICPSCCSCRESCPSCPSCRESCRGSCQCPGCDCHRRPETAADTADGDAHASEADHLTGEWRPAAPGGSDVISTQPSAPPPPTPLPRVLPAAWVAGDAGGGRRWRGGNDVWVIPEAPGSPLPPPTAASGVPTAPPVADALAAPPSYSECVVAPGGGSRGGTSAISPPRGDHPHADPPREDPEQLPSYEEAVPRAGPPGSPPPPAQPPAATPSSPPSRADEPPPSYSSVWDPTCRGYRR